MFRRPFRRPFRRVMMDGVPPLLKRANELMATGNYAAAATLYEQLARGAQARGIPRDAPLLLQAGRCHLLAGQVPAGMVDLKQGLGIIQRSGNTERLQKAGQRTITDLKQRGLTAEAAEIETMLPGVLPATPAGEGATSPAVPSAPTPAKLRMLPTTCPECGGPLRPDEIDWMDEATAECPFCGSGVRAE